MSTPFSTSKLILNWTAVQKCLLMLGLTAGIQFIWMLWKVFVYFRPELWQFTSIELIKQAITINALVFLGYLVLILFCYYVRHVKQAHTILPYVCCLYYSFASCHETYLYGIMCPAASLSTVMSVTIGLFLFERKVVYSSLAISMLLLATLLLATFKGDLAYAPIFIASGKTDILASTIFWTLSMVWLMLPTLTVGFLLLEILLSQWRNREKAVRVLSQTDPLTGLYNRRTIHHFTSKLLKENFNTTALNAVVMLDLDFFKRINDTYGHSIGDKVLSIAAEVLKRCVRRDDKVGRFGGEEFIIIICNTTHEQVKLIADRCRRELMQVDLSSTHIENLVITASFGVTLFKTGNPAATLDMLLKEADTALYAAKNQGRNQIIFYENPQFINSITA